MRGSVSLALLLVLAGKQAVAQSSSVPESEQKGFATFNQDSLHHDVAFLASDHLQGRMSMQPGDDLAVQWIAGQFARAGLDPVGFRPNGMPGYEQSFKIIQYVPDRVNSSFTLTRAGKPTVWHAPEAFGAYKNGAEITAPVVFAGYGITAPELKYDDYTGLDVKGKIVLIFDHEPQEENPDSVFYGTGNTKYATSRVKLLNAQLHGAVAVITVAEPNRKHPTNAERVARIGGSAVRATPIPLQAIEDDEVTIPAVTIVDEVANALFATSGTTASAQQTKIDATLLPQGMDLPDTTVSLHLHNISEDDGRISNVVGLLKGSDPALKAETIIVSAHHDHDGNAPCVAGEGGIDQEGQPIAAGADCMQTWHGADDNASGTAGVIALARAFAANGAKPKRSILFVVFAAEERGLLGSYWMAAHPLRPLATTRAVINFDMIGRDEKASPQTDGLMDVPADTSNRLNLVGAEYSPDYALIVADENRNTGLTIDDRFDHEHILNVLFRSDQFPFLLHNVPAMWWFTGFHPDYHHITDTAEKLDYAKMAKILQLAYLSAWRFGSDEGTPKFIEDPPPRAPPTIINAATPDAAPAPEEPHHHHRPIAPVSIAPTTTAAPDATQTAPPPAVAPVAVPVTAAPGVDAMPQTHAPITPVAVPVTAAPAADATPETHAPIAPVAMPVTEPTPASAPVAAPNAGTTPVANAPDATQAEPPRHHRPIAPVQIRATTGEAGEAATGPPASTPTIMTTPVAPITTDTSGTGTATPATTTSSPASRPAVTPVQIAPPPPSTQPPAVTPAVTPVKLGGKQPGQDEYDDPK